MEAVIAQTIIPIYTNNGGGGGSPGWWGAGYGIVAAVLLVGWIIYIFAIYLPSPDRDYWEREDGAMTPCLVALVAAALWPLGLPTFLGFLLRHRYQVWADRKRDGLAAQRAALQAEVDALEKVRDEAMAEVDEIERRAMGVGHTPVDGST